MSPSLNGKIRQKYGPRSTLTIQDVPKRGDRGQGSLSICNVHPVIGSARNKILFMVRILAVNSVQ